MSVERQNSTLMFISVVLDSLLYWRWIKDECRFQNSMSKAVNQKFDCTYKTLDTVYSLSFIFSVHCS